MIATALSVLQRAILSHRLDFVLPQQPMQGIYASPVPFPTDLFPFQLYVIALHPARSIYNLEQCHLQYNKHAVKEFIRKQ